MKKELTDEEYIDYSLKANKPRIIFPIINSIISIVLLVALIYFFIKDEIKLGFLIFGIIVVILFPLSSWYSSYFSKKKTTTKINNFKAETENLIKYASSFKGYTMVESTKTKYITSNDDYISEYAKFDQKTNLINSGRIKGALLSYGVSFIGLDVDPNTKKVLNVTGMLPTSIFYEKKLVEPLSTKGTLEIEDENLKKFTVIQALSNANSYYDKTTGWVCIGDKKTKDTTNVKIMENVIIALKDTEISSFWINVGILEDNNGKNKADEK